MWKRHKKAQQADAALTRWPHAACCAFLWRFDMEASFGRVRLDPDSSLTAMAYVGGEADAVRINLKWCDPRLF